MRIKKIKRKFLTVINDPRSVLVKILYFFSPVFDDRTYLKMLFPLKTGYRLNLDKPKTYNEKLQWLKINYRKAIMTRMVDKYEAKSVAMDIIGEKYIVKNLGVWNSFEEINFDELPNGFVLKTTHDQGGVVIVTDKNNFDKESAKKKLVQHLKIKHFYLSREWPYKNVKPRIMAEALLTNDEIGDLWDYKFYCFHGEPRIMYISHGRHTSQCYLDFYDMEFNKLNIGRRGYAQSTKSIAIPENWELMKELAAKLSKDLPHVRVDFYVTNGQVYLGELTFFQGGGMMPFYPHSWDQKLGDWINIEALKH